MQESLPRTSNRPIFSPPILLATWFGVGLLPKAPGTWGSLAALPFAWWIATTGGYVAIFIGVLLIFMAGCWASEIYIQRMGGEDPGPVVIDEVAGQWLAVSLVPPDILLYSLGFLLFRFTDIVKPWPVRWADSGIKGGFGIMFDDLLAGLYAAVLLYAFQEIEVQRVFMWQL